MKRLCVELNLLALCVSFFTRLPLPSSLHYSDHNMHRSGRYFSLVGAMLAGIVAIVVSVLTTLLPVVPALVLGLIVSLLSTGAFHEDGLADTFDAFWGGMTKERKLTIMKDGRLGTYGVSALTLALILKASLWFALWEQGQFYIALFIAYPLSRAMALSFIQDLPYARKDEDKEMSKSAPLTRPLPTGDLNVLFIIALVPAVLLLSLMHFVLLLCACFVVRYLLKQLFIKHIDGVTGDCLGAAQQIQEMSIYVILLMLVGTP